MFSAGLALKLYETFCRLSSSDCLFVNERLWKYSELLTFSEGIRRSFFYRNDERVGILCHRSIEYYASVLSCVLDKKTFVPLGVKHPENRLLSIIEESDLDCVLYSSEYEELKNFLSARLENVRFEKVDITFEQFESYTPPRLLHASSEEFSYILFTSGSTGKPKGVPVSYLSLEAYLGFMVGYIELTGNDRVTQLFSPTFDLSLHDIFTTWLGGATLYVVPENQLLAPAKFVKSHKITVWFSVPSTAAIMSKLSLLKPDSMPDLRLSLFCGEALSYDLALKWSEAASNSKVVNLYGPTEATIACAYYEFEKGRYVNSVLPLGKPFASNQFCLSEKGELLVGGTQVFSGYLGADDRNNCFQDINGSTFYQTGDCSILDEYGNYIFLGRVDDQVKINGHRIELPEINTLVSRFLNSSLVYTIAYPKESPNKIILFIPDDIDDVSNNEINDFLLSNLPSYMLPKEIKKLAVDDFPLNTSGKIDKNKLYLMI